MNKLVFKSNTEGKLKKLLNGSIFNSSTTFITELFQNSQRAKAKNVVINQYGNTFKFSDDGIGLKNPQGLMTFDYSEWDSTDEGFGIGFWSVLAISELSKIEIESNQYHIVCDVNKLRNILNGDSKDKIEDVLSLEAKELKTKGFTVILTSNYFECTDIKYTVQDCCEYLNLKVAYNDEFLENSDVLDKVEGLFIRDYSTRLFTARLSVNESSYKHAEIYYEDRKVCTFYSLPYVTGIIKLRPKALTLREPDRTDVVYDSKRNTFSEKLEEVIKKLYKEFLPTATNDNLLEDYERGIVNYLGVNDYEKFLLLDDVEIIKEKIKINESTQEIEDDSENEEINKEETCETNNEEHIIFKSPFESNVSPIVGDTGQKSPFYNIVSTHDDGSLMNDNSNTSIMSSVAVEDDTDEVSSVVEEPAEDVVENNKNDIFKSNDYIDKDKNTESFGITSVTKDSKKTSEKKALLKDYIKKNKNVVWVEASRTENYKDTISLAEYHGIKVLIAKNKLLEAFFKEKEIDYISTLNDKISIVKTYTDIKPKTDKETVFLKMLEPIRLKYKLPVGCFRIGNIYETTTIALNKEIKVIKVKNTSNDVKIFSVCRQDEIVFDRTALALRKFNLSLTNGVSIGKNELKCMLCNIESIAHELAHMLYRTTDNTVEHYKAQHKLQSEIAKLYLKY